MQWTNQGTDQFAQSRQVLGLSDCGEWAFVEGTETGLPVSELTVVAPKMDTKQPPVSPFQRAASGPKDRPAPPPDGRDGPVVKFDLPRGNAIEIRLKAKVTHAEFQKIKRIFELSEVAFVAEEGEDRREETKE